MGCAPSMLDEEIINKNDDGDYDLMDPLNIDTNNPDSLLRAYIRLDKEILQLENTNPAPNYGQTLAAINHIKAIIADTEGRLPNSDDDHDEISSLFMELGLYRSPNVAAEHEEFIAEANRRVLEKNLVRILQKFLVIQERKLEITSERVNTLQHLYQQQEALLSTAFGSTYGSTKEKEIEQETDTMRNFRDNLALGVLQWNACAESLKQACDLSQRGVISWKSLKKQTIDKKIRLAAEARNNFQETLFLVQECQSTLNGVQFPYCSERELSAVMQALQYVFTDFLIEERYNHAHQVYENFQQRVVALYKWVNKTQNSSLKKDLEEFDFKVVKIVKKLREERINLLCEKFKIPNNYSEFGLNPKVNELTPYTRGEPTSFYQKPMVPETRYTKENMYGDVLSPQATNNGRINLGPAPTYQDDPRAFSDPNFQRDFETKLAERRSAMWPSRRMEELRQLTLREF